MQTSSASADLSDKTIRPYFHPPSGHPNPLRARSPAFITEGTGMAISILPIELLRTIFAYCLPLVPYIEPRPSLAPMLLCQICSYWRRVALSMPILWSSLGATNPNSPLPYDTSLIRLWLDRSCAYPLSLQLPHARHLTEVMLAIFTNHIHRWRDVRLTLSKSLLKRLTTLPLESAPMLESINLDVDAEVTHSINQVCTLLKSFSALRQLTWRSFHHMSLINIPWSQLTHVDLHCELTMNELFVLLAQCSCVVNFMLYHISDSSTPESSDNLFLPSLINMELHSYHAITPIFRHFTLPALRTLVLHEWSSVLQTRTSFESFLLRSSCQLEKLVLEGSLLLEEDLIYCLHLSQLQSLRHFARLSSCITDHTLNALTRRAGNNGSDILPLLEIVYLDGCHTSDGLFADMIASRLPSTSTHFHPSIKRAKATFNGLGRVNERLDLSMEDDIILYAHKIDIERSLDFISRGLIVLFDFEHDRRHLGYKLFI